MAQSKGKAATEVTVENIGKFSPPYMRGLRDAFASIRQYIALQDDHISHVGDKLGIPFYAMMLIVEGDHISVELSDVDDMTAWLETHELSRAQAFGEEA